VSNAVTSEAMPGGLVGMVDHWTRLTSARTAPHTE
jgi:hypothetical protein